MSADNPRWRTFPLLLELFRQWRAARGNAPAGLYQQAFRRNWDALLEDAGIIVPVSAEERLRALFADELSSFEPRFDLTKVDWQPELAFLLNTRVGVSGEDLLKLNEFLANRQSRVTTVPIKERSLEIFGDEKRLDALRNTVLFEDGRLTLEQLFCFAVSEPLGWQRGPINEGPLLVIENACTWDSYCRWNATRGLFSVVVYGGGNRFLDSFARLKDVFTEIGGVRRVLYFGDIDPQGLRIPQIASRRAERQGLPAIEPHSWSYERLLELGSNRAVPLGEKDRLDANDFVWLGESASKAKAVLDSGMRIAQEHLGWDFLSKQDIARQNS